MVSGTVQNITAPTGPRRLLRHHVHIQSAVPPPDGIITIPHYFVIGKTGRLSDAAARGKLDEIIPDLLAK